MKARKNLYVIMLGLVLVKNAGRIAGSVVSGNPSLDFGAVAHQMHGMSHAARSGMRMAKGGMSEEFKLVKVYGKSFIRSIPDNKLMVESVVDFPGWERD